MITEINVFTELYESSTMQDFPAFQSHSKAVLSNHLSHRLGIYFQTHFHWTVNVTFQVLRKRNCM